MPDSAIIYIALFACFVILILFIRFWPVGKSTKDVMALMYYKLELPERKTTTISNTDFGEHCKKLIAKNYELIFLPELKSFTEHKSKLPDTSFLIAFDEQYSYTLKTALPLLLSENITIIIFIPIIVAGGNNPDTKSRVQQLNEFIFSEEFKNIFGYTQPNTQIPATIQ